jgi:hypothetical protein
MEGRTKARTDSGANACCSVARAAQQPHAGIREIDKVHAPYCPTNMGTSALAPQARRSVVDAVCWATLTSGVAAFLLCSACSTGSRLEVEQKGPMRLPLTFMNSNPVATITVGDQDVPVVVDTGGGGIALSVEVIEAAGGRRLDQYSSGPDAYGREIRSPKYKVASITIGGRAFSDVVVTQAESRPAGGGPPVPGSIGRELLSHYFVVIDYARKSIDLWPDNARSSAAGCGTNKVPMERTKDPGLVVLSFSTPSGPMRAVLDTGATYSIMPEWLVKERKLETVLHGQQPFYGLANVVAAKRELGPMEFVVLPVQPPADFQVFLGWNFFSNRVVCIDYENRQVLTP